MRRSRIFLLAPMLAFVSSIAYAQDTTDDDSAADFELTMTLLPEGATRPDAVTRVIELPGSAAPEATENARGLDTANDARSRRAAGLDIATDATQRGRAFGEAMREQAQENREDAGRESPEPPNRPDLPDRPGPANPPGPPGN